MRCSRFRRSYRARNLLLAHRRVGNDRKSIANLTKNLSIGGRFSQRKWLRYAQTCGRKFNHPHQVLPTAQVERSSQDFDNRRRAETRILILINKLITAEDKLRRLQTRTDNIKEIADLHSELVKLEDRRSSAVGAIRSLERKTAKTRERLVRAETEVNMWKADLKSEEKAAEASSQALSDPQISKVFHKLRMVPSAHLENDASNETEAQFVWSLAERRRTRAEFRQESDQLADAGSDF